MDVKKLDVTGMKCSQPILKITVMSPDMKPGEILEVIGDCVGFEKDVRNWADRMGKVILSVKDEGDNKLAIQIQF